jgi:hypothetical protein
MLRGRRAVFVGCKDGSITAIQEEPASRGAFRIPTRLPGWNRNAPRHAVRAICEWDDRHLIVGHSDGSVGLLAWNQRNSRPIPVCESGTDPENAVSSIHPIGEGRLLISFRRTGAHVYRASGGRGEPPFVLVEKLADLRDIRRAIPLQDERWLMVTSSGELFLWSDGGRREDWDWWRTDEQPGFLGDVATLPALGGPADSAEGVFLATDNGVFFLDLGPQGLGTPVRIALPGLKSFCMALSYVEDQDHGFLWAADSSGDCHLFWTEARRDGSRFEPNFQPSGIVYVGSQVMFALSWRSAGRDGSIVFAQARRNDRIAFAEYRILTGTTAAGTQGVNLHRHLLRNGSVAEIREVIDPTGRLTRGWPDAAVLADFFELLAADEKDLKVLEEFLSNPSADVAHRILQELHRDEVKIAVRLWTFALLGIVNRIRGRDQSTSYLGIIRWLQELTACPGLDAEVKLEQEVRKAVRFARKWGLFGEANALRQSLSGPIETLRRQLGEANFKRQPEALDLLTFESLLFERSTDLLCEEAHGRLRGRTAWDLSTLEVGNRTLVAVSWKLGGVDLFELRREPEGARLVLYAAIVPEVKDRRYRFRIRRFGPGRYRGPEQGWQLDYGYSRAVFLGRVGDRIYLLTAPALGSQAAERERLVVHEILLSQEGIRVRKAGSRALPKGESVYRFLGMEEGAVLAGLRGSGGVPGVARVEVVPGEQGLRLKARACFLRLQRASKPATDSSTPSQATLQNRVWSMALAGRQAFVGLESGEIWYWQTGSWPRVIDVSSAARMSAPVTALAARAEGDTCRIFAGGTDGSIVAWQEVVDPKQEGRKDRRFVSLWATFERGTVAALHPLRAAPSSPRDGPMVLVALRTGRCVLLDDRQDVEKKEEETGAPQRAAVPGARIARLELPGTTFACATLERLAGKGRENARDAAQGRSALLLTASERGEVRLISLNYLRRDFRSPSGEPLRTGKFKDILARWWQIVTFDQGRLDRLRLADAIYQSIQLQPLILVRWLIDRAAPPIPGAPDPDDEKTWANLPWQMPRYLRPLLALRKAWAPDRKSDGTAGRALEELLRNAWQLEDRKLFQELCIVMLKASNFAVYSSAAGQDGPPGDRVQPLYFEIFETIERGVQRWVGMPYQQEANIRMVVAKNMIDGDTFLSVVRRAAEEHRRGQPGPFWTIFEKRIEAVRQLVFKRDPLVSLETLRAMNLSLTRLCSRLVEARRKGWKPVEEPSDQEAYWPVFEHYFKELINAAQRTLRFRFDLNDAFTHEYCRTFALVVCACPSAAIRIANRMTETQLISDPRSDEDFSWQVFFQFTVLEQMGLPLPPEALHCFKIAVQPPEKVLDPVPELLDKLKGADLTLQDFEDRTPRAVAKLGKPNVDDLYCLRKVYRVVGWLQGLARKLATDARDLDLTAETRDELKGILKADETLTELYSHSQGFWLSALSRLDDECLLRKTSLPHIRPEAVLTSRALARWARRCIDDLDLRYREQRIFQPEYLFFREVLARLERAAEQFPRSAAVQKSIALSVFNHHLLEDLDEHVFELEELAQNLDPLMVWSFREEGRKLPPIGDGQPVAYRFAHYLLRRAHHAESIPKNLRTLYGILDSPPEPAPGTAEQAYQLERFLSPYREWCGAPEAGITIRADEFQYLSLSLAELARNDAQHSGLTPEEREGGRGPRLSCVFSYTPAGSRELTSLEVGIWLRPNGDGPESNRGRLKTLAGNDLQQPLDPHTDPNVPSTGAGLYLANLAASVVRWEIRLEVGDDPVDGLVPGAFRFERKEESHD